METGQQPCLSLASLGDSVTCNFISGIWDYIAMNYENSWAGWNDFSDKRLTFATKPHTLLLLILTINKSQPVSPVRE
jgi:hypothetical protein